MISDLAFFELFSHTKKCQQNKELSFLFIDRKCTNICFSRVMERLKKGISIVHKEAIQIVSKKYTKSAYLLFLIVSFYIWALVDIVETSLPLLPLYNLFNLTLLGNFTTATHSWNLSTATLLDNLFTPNPLDNLPHSYPSWTTSSLLLILDNLFTPNHFEQLLHSYPLKKMIFLFFRTTPSLLSILNNHCHNPFWTLSLFLPLWTASSLRSLLGSLFTYDFWITCHFQPLWESLFLPVLNNLFSPPSFEQPFYFFPFWEKKLSIPTPLAILPTPVHLGQPRLLGHSTHSCPFGPTSIATPDPLAILPTPVHLGQPRLPLLILSDDILPTRTFSGPLVDGTALCFNIKNISQCCAHRHTCIYTSQSCVYVVYVNAKIL